MSSFTHIFMAVLLSHGNHCDPSVSFHEVNQCQSTNNRQCEQCIYGISEKNDVGTLNDHLTREFIHLTGSADTRKAYHHNGINTNREEIGLNRKHARERGRESEKHRNRCRTIFFQSNA